MMFGVGPLGALRPGIVLRKALRIEEARAQRLAARLVVDDARDDMRESAELDPWRGAFEVSRLFAVELNEGSAIINRILIVAYLAEQVGGEAVEAAIAAIVAIITVVDADEQQCMSRYVG